MDNLTTDRTHDEIIADIVHESFEMIISLCKMEKLEKELLNVKEEM